MSVGVVACGAIATHIAQIAQRRDWAITIYPLPPLLHNRPEKIADEVDQLLTELTGKFDSLAVAYADCGTYGALDAVISRHQVPRLAGNHCYDIFAGQAEIERLAEEEPGTYFLTDFLVRSFHRSVIVELGLDRRPELLPDYFGNYRRIVWLATSPTDELHIAATQAADALNLTLEIRPVGDSGLERALAEILRFA
ncbi:hypothetical protein GALL_460100 [mine drainage metagenome]|uniref:DUF1638 domain-containing protein n=1 Tax=mine drainage metagenome TaxID=410659 RepID=A0A1J5Q8S9_9ZZZZ